MITFLTLFLGLVSGRQAVSVTVSAPATAIELWLDGARVARLGAPPWQADIDFGPGLLPHELMARALDAEGHELATTRQLINLPRPSAEAALLLERDAAGRPVAVRVSGADLLGAHPAAVALTLDGTALPLDEKLRAALPPVDLALAHVIHADLRFPDGLLARHDAVFGGGLGDEVHTELTAVALRQRSRVNGLATLAQINDSAPLRAATDGARSLRAVAIEDGPGLVVVVRDPADRHAPRPPGAARPGLQYSGLSRLANAPVPVRPVAEDPRRLRYALGLGKEDRQRLLSALPRLVDATGVPVKLFDSSPDWTVADGGFYWLLGRTGLVPAGDARPRFADATAVAGLQAMAESRRRAVVLVLTGGGADPSHYDPAAARAYLAAIRVPLFVWWLGDARPDPAWGPAHEVNGWNGLQRAVAQLDAELRAQRIVWLDGSYPPGAVALSREAQAAGVSFAACPPAGCG